VKTVLIKEIKKDKQCFTSVKTVPAMMIISDVCNACRKQREHEVVAVDSGYAGTVHPFITGCQVLQV